MTMHRFSIYSVPVRFGLKGRNVVLRPLAADDRPQILAFAKTLTDEDLLFLQRDMTQTAEVDAWIKDTLDGNLGTLLAFENDAVVGYATYSLGSARWTPHVAELRVVVTPSARGVGIARALLERTFEMALDAGASKIIARMTPEQTGPRALFENLGFKEEAILREHARDAHGLTHDLLILSFHARAQEAPLCDVCGVRVLHALNLEGARLCSTCYEARYRELGVH